MDRMAEKSHYHDDGPKNPRGTHGPTETTDVASQPAGLLPPPDLDWDNWRRSVNELKAERGISINMISQRSGLDRSTVIELLNGRRQVKSFRVDTLWALAWALGVHPEDFPEFLKPLAVPDTGDRQN